MSLEAIILEQMTILTAHRPQNLSSSLLDVPCLPAFEVMAFMITFYGQGKIRIILYTRHKKRTATYSN